MFQKIVALASRKPSNQQKLSALVSCELLIHGCISTKSLPVRPALLNVAREYPTQVRPLLVLQKCLLQFHVSPLDQHLPHPLVLDKIVFIKVFTDGFPCGRYGKINVIDCQNAGNLPERSDREAIKRLTTAERVTEGQVC